MITYISKTFYVSVVMLFIFSAQACKKEAPGTGQQQAPAKPYPVVSVPTDTVTVFSEYPTTIQGVVNNDIRAKIQGYITQVYVEEGQHVSKGQPLFKLETNTLSQQANAAKSGINAAESNISAAKAAVNAAQIEVNRLTPLVNKGIISSVQLETANASLLSAQSQLKQAQATKQQAQANYQSVAANVNYGTVRAPISGIVGSLPLKKGSLVGPSDPTPLTTVSDVSELYAYFSMNEKEYFNFLEQVEGKTLKNKLNNLPPVSLRLANGSEYAEKGKVETATGQIDPNTGTIQFRASFSNENGLLTNGNSGTVLIPNIFENVLVVPEASTFEQQGVTYVYKVKQDTAISSIIKVKEKANNLTIIESGLKKGDKIVAVGVGNLRTGTPIKAVPADFDSIVQSVKTVF